MRKWIKYLTCCIITALLMLLAMRWGIFAVLIVYTLGLVHVTYLYEKDKEKRK